MDDIVIEIVFYLRFLIILFMNEATRGKENKVSKYI